MRSFGAMHDSYLDPDGVMPEAGCEVCGRDAMDCDCPECPECGIQGDPECYSRCKLEPAPDSVHAFCQFLGIEPIAEALRAIEKYSVEHVYLVLANPLSDGKFRVYYHDACSLKLIQPWMRLVRVGVAGIAWDTTEWEWAKEVDVEGGFEGVSAARQEFHDALEEHRQLMRDEFEDYDEWF